MSVLNLQDNLTASNNSDDSKVRLQVALAHAGVASRRACEKIITDGQVTVNGAVVTELGTKVSPEDIICVNGQQVFQEARKRYVLLNKPIGYVCSLSEENERPGEPARNLAIDLLKPHFAERLYNVGRLDMYSSGLILFTNDGDFAAVVSHPSAQLEKEYIVETSLPYPRFLPEKFMRGVRVDGVFYKCKFAEGLSSHKMRIVLIEGKNREIRRVIESFDLRVKSLTRVRIGFISAKLPDGSLLQPGSFRELEQSEVSELLKLCRENKEAPVLHVHKRDFAKPETDDRKHEKSKSESRRSAKNGAAAFYKKRNETDITKKHDSEESVSEYKY